MLARTGETETWDVPTPSASLRAVVRVPGSKSQTARLLVLAALGDGESRLRMPLHARDTELMAAALRVLGHGVEPAPDAADDWIVTPAALIADADEKRGPVTVDVGLSGTVTRFLPAVAAMGACDVHFDGDPRIRERPVGPLIDALTQLGADIDHGGRRALPMTVAGRGALTGGSATLDASDSSQLISGLLLAAPRTSQGVVIRHLGPPVPSAPHIAMTVTELRRSGAVVEDGEPDVWRVEPRALRARDVTVEPDLSSVFPFLVAPLLTGGTVTLAGWPNDSTQPGAVLPELLARLGGRVELTGDQLRVTGGPGVFGIEESFADFPEAVPVLAALLMFADRPSRLTGVAHLRTQETDRLLALVEELGTLGADIRELPDGLEIRPTAALHPAELDPREDHRLAMAYAVAGLRIPGLRIRDAGTVAKTVPDFRQRWTAMLDSAGARESAGTVETAGG